MMRSLAKPVRRSRSVSLPCVVGTMPQSLDMGLASRFLLPPCADPHHAIVEVMGTTFPPVINGGDLVCVDFTCTRLTVNSLYVVVLNDSMAQWIGIRRFHQLTNGEWALFDAPDAAPRMITYADLMQIQIVGRVKNVFKSARYGT